MWQNIHFKSGVPADHSWYVGWLKMRFIAEYAVSTWVIEDLAFEGPYLTGALRLCLPSWPPWSVQLCLYMPFCRALSWILWFRSRISANDIMHSSVRLLKHELPCYQKSIVGKGSGMAWNSSYPRSSLHTVGFLATISGVCLLPNTLPAFLPWSQPANQRLKALKLRAKIMLLSFKWWV